MFVCSRYYKYTNQAPTWLKSNSDTYYSSFVPKTKYKLNPNPLDQSNRLVLLNVGILDCINIRTHGAVIYHDIGTKIIKK